MRHSKLLALALVTSLFLGSGVSAAGSGQQPSAEYKVCVKTAFEVRQTNLSAALGTYLGDVKAALDAKKEGLAAGLVDPVLVWSAYYAARTGAEHDYTNARLGIWESYRITKDACAQGI